MQSSSEFSVPTQATLSRKMGPVPWPKEELNNPVLSVWEEHNMSHDTVSFALNKEVYSYAQPDQCTKNRYIFVKNVFAKTQQRKFHYRINLPV